MNPFMITFLTKNGKQKPGDSAFLDPQEEDVYSNTESHFLDGEMDEDTEVSNQPTSDPNPFDLPFQDPFNHLPAGHILLGMGEDGLPVLLNMLDHENGSVLAISDELEDTYDLLRAAACSACHPTATQTILLAIITPDPDRWRAEFDLPQNRRRLLGIYTAEQAEAGNILARLAVAARRRALGQEKHQPVLLLFEGLEAADKMNFKTRLDLEWLTRVGPSVGIKMIATLLPEAPASLKGIIPTFTTWLSGWVEHQDSRRQLGARISPGLELKVPAGSFRLLEPGAPLQFEIIPFTTS
ncbi:MAG TPA: hypothetical protein VIO61_15695 [Anaerolineaceae bacterium]